MTLSAVNKARSSTNESRSALGRIALVNNIVELNRWLVGEVLLYFWRSKVHIVPSSSVLTVIFVIGHAHKTFIDMFSNLGGMLGIFG